MMVAPRETPATQERNEQLRETGYVLRCGNCRNIVKRDRMSHLEDPPVASRCTQLVPYRAAT